MKKKILIEDSKIPKEITLKKNKSLENTETLLSFGGVLFPPLSILGLGVGFINKKYAQENLNTIIDHLDNVKFDIEKIKNLCEEEKRNFSFNVQKTINNVIREKSVEKIELFANLLTNGINSGIIFLDNDYYDEMLDLLFDLNRNDIKLLKLMDKNTSDFDIKLNLYSEFAENDIKTSYLSDGTKIKNYFGFDDYDINRIKKMVSLGIVSEDIKLEIKDKSVIAPGFGNSIRYYKLTSRYSEFKKYVIDNSKSSINS